jgi:hypothetical protein
MLQVPALLPSRGSVPVRVILQHGATSLPLITFFGQCGCPPLRCRSAVRAASGHPAAGLRRLLPLLAVLAWPLSPAHAEPTARDLQVLARALGFLERPAGSSAEIGIVYPQQSAAGKAEAMRIASFFGDGLRAGTLTVRPKLVTLEAVAEAGAAALLLTDAAVAQAPRIAHAVAGRSILTVTSDRALIEAGSVVMVVRSEPRVEVLVNRAAAQAAGVTFAPAFRMMIQER